MYKKLLYLIFLFAASQVSAQTVVIKSDNEVCLNELLIFQSVITGSPSSFSWNFGDGSTSTQANPSHSYTNFGQVTVTLTVSFSGSADVTTSKNILVNDLPKADFSLDNSSFCSNDINVCLTDKSTMGGTTSGYSSREILWGDGSQNISSSPAKGQKICFKNYPKTAPAKYIITVEVVNDKGCENKWQREIAILKGYKPSFSIRPSGSNCDVQTICVTNDSIFSSSEIQSFEFDFGDGTTNTTDWTNACHSYTKSGSYSVKLMVILKNGCSAVLTRVANINVVSFQNDPQIGDSVLCYPQEFSVYHQSIPNATYSWVLYSKDTTFIQGVGANAVQSVTVPCPDDYLLKLVISVGGCMKTSRWINLVSNGVSAKFKPLNWYQCESKDTVYFLNLSKYHPKSKPSYSWFFDDSLSSDCIGFNQNCNKDTIEHTRHFYLDTGCMNPYLIVEDLVSGCVSRYDSIVKIKTSDKDFEFQMLRPCLGNKQEYGVVLTVEKCDPDIRVCKDSLANSKLFSPLTANRLTYASAKDKNGWITVGFATQAGDSIVYRSANLTDYYLNPSRICRDTVWKHRWFQLHPEPRIGFKLTKDTLCLPITATIQYIDSQQSKLDFFKYYWNQNEPFTTYYITDSIPKISHTYTKEGPVTIYIILQDTFGCYNQLSFKESFGFENQIISDTQLCRISEVTINQYVRYFNDSYPWWLDTSNVEKLLWDFGDGGGFSTGGPNPKHIFKTAGTYNIRMASNDKNGCRDTASALVHVNGINAAIRKNTKDYLCDQILQFFDSSFFDFTPTADKVKSYTWDFGDFSTLSYLKDPYHFYSSNGDFTLTLSVETNYGCVDTAHIPIFIKGPEPFFTVTSDTVGCVPFTASFSSFSKNISALIWRMGDSSSNTIFSTKDTTFSYTYTKPGIYYVYLEGSDSFYNEASNNKYTCSAIFPDINSKLAPVRRIVVLPIPEVNFTFIEPLCVGQELVFIDKSDSIYSLFNWQIDGVSVSSAQNLSYTFDKPGIHTISLLPTYVPTGPYQRACYYEYSNVINVSDVSAKFGWELKGICNEFFFVDSSSNASIFRWEFDHPKSKEKNQSNLANPSHLYGTDAGDYNVCLWVTNDLGCKDSICTDITAVYMSELKSYNVFTPNNDGYNDVFLIDLDNVSMYDLKIFDRWGECIFESLDPKKGWNGNRRDTPNLLPPSTYFYILRYTFNCEKTEREIEGIVELLR